MAQWRACIVRYVVTQPLIFLRLFLIASAFSACASFILYWTTAQCSGVLEASSVTHDVKRPARCTCKHCRRSRCCKQQRTFSPVNRSRQRLLDEASRYARKHHVDPKKVRALYISKELAQSTVEAKRTNGTRRAAVLLAMRQTNKAKMAPAGLHFTAPLKRGSYRISSAFGSPRPHGRKHQGVDLAVPKGTPVRAVCRGRVEYAGWLPGYGNVVILVHSKGIRTIYGHLSRIFAREKQTVDADDVIAYSGRSGFCMGQNGEHLHFQMEKDGHPVDPRRFVRL